MKIPELSGLPGDVAGWSVTPINAGLWLSRTPGPVPENVLALEPDPGRLSLVVSAAGPDQRTDELIGRLFSLLAPGRPAVRLVLSAAADRYAAVAATHGLDLIAAEAEVAITPYGYAVVRSAGPTTSGRLPQWRRCLPGRNEAVVGALSPSPSWEHRLAATRAEFADQDVTVRRVPAGLAIHAGRADDAPWDALAGDAVRADDVWPDPERLTIAVAGHGRHVLLEYLSQLLPALLPGPADGVRLYWPRAAAGDRGSELLALAVSVGCDLIAPTGDISVSGYGSVCHGPAGAAPWLRFTGQGNVYRKESLYPPPTWCQGIAGADLSDLSETLDIEHVAAGLCLRWPGPAERGLIATARSLIPDPVRATIVVGGDVRNQDDRLALQSVLLRLPSGALRRLRILLSYAGSGGSESYAQYLADMFSSEISAPAQRWTATPDGRLRAYPAAGGAGPVAADGAWLEFAPRAGRTGQHAGRPSGQAVPVADPVVDAADPVLEPEPVGTDTQSPAVSEVMATSSEPTSVTLVQRDHLSSAQERRSYRESAARYQWYAVAVRRMLTQRPGLRVAAASDAGDAVVTDFAALLELLADEHRGVTSAPRSSGAAPDPRTLCAISGLRRLPSFTGAVFSSADLPGTAISSYRPGAVVVEPDFVFGTSSRLVTLAGNTEYLIWSHTGRRVSALAEDASPDEIVFAAGGTYLVLNADPGRAGAERNRVFLRELPRSDPDQPALPSGLMSQSGGQLDEMNFDILHRLLTAVALRDEVGPGDQILTWRASSAGQPIGLDAGWAPFQRTI
jgi:hypothetical protein